jgi:hypothetical protein
VVHGSDIKMERSLILRVALAVALAGCTPGVMCAMRAADQPSIEELKGRVAHASVADRPPLCLQIAERQLQEVGKFYGAGDSDQAQAALMDVVTFAGLDRDYSIQSHKHEKQSEIAIRKMARKLADVKHATSHEDQEQIQSAIDRLQQIRDDLLTAMFPKAGKR